MHCVAMLATTPSIPRLPESFVVSTTEVADSDGGSVVVQQFIARDTDSPARVRSRMVATGSLVHGYLEETLACPGKMIAIGGPDSQTDHLQCNVHNVTHCDIEPFWDFPPGAVYEASEVVAGRFADRFAYKTGGEHFRAWFTPSDAPYGAGEPVRIAKLSSNMSSLWHIDFSAFVAGAPADGAFTLSPPASRVRGCAPIETASDRAVKRSRSPLKRSLLALGVHHQHDWAGSEPAAAVASPPTGAGQSPILDSAELVSTSRR